MSCYRPLSVSANIVVFCIYSRYQEMLRDFYNCVAHVLPVFREVAASSVTFMFILTCS